jgi:hypothetical protein
MRDIGINTGITITLCAIIISMLVGVLSTRYMEEQTARIAIESGLEEAITFSPADIPYRMWVNPSNSEVME